ncbi:MAG: imidazole glycerol phosphate synthase subunit HisH [Chthoniobacteraceae bacterium]|nr:imidazole glycerol phosphate synthase subunit HisH [Chthoniobacteraceae bacterium]
MIALIDYGSGNIRSVFKALQHEGADVRLVGTPEGLAQADGVVLPGVGAFADCVEGIASRGLWDPLQAWLQSGRPFLGICVGYQLLFETSEEAPESVRGFGFFAGKVRRFTTPGLKVPQIGWNSLEFPEGGHWLWNGLPANPHVFFVHSYYPEPKNPAEAIATCEYGVPFAAAAARGNVAGVQFHPEKSQAAGLRILRNFLDHTAAETAAV